MPELAYIPAPNSPSYRPKSPEEDDDDPLDAYMAGIEKQVSYTSILSNYTL